MNIKPYDITVRALLETGFYRIPRFQRPYSWELEHVSDFWEDTVVAEDEDYFIGSFVLYTDSGQEDLYFIVDGQQRMTTITLLFAVLRDVLFELNQNSLGLGEWCLVCLAWNLKRLHKLATS